MEIMASKVSLMSPMCDTDWHMDTKAAIGTSHVNLRFQTVESGINMGNSSPQSDMFWYTAEIWLLRWGWGQKCNFMLLTVAPHLHLVSSCAARKHYIHVKACTLDMCACVVGHKVFHSDIFGVLSKMVFIFFIVLRRCTVWPVANNTWRMNTPQG